MPKNYKNYKFIVIKGDKWKIVDNGGILQLYIPQNICFGVGVMMLADDINDVVCGEVGIEEFRRKFQCEGKTPIIEMIIEALEKNREVWASFDTDNVNNISTVSIEGTLFVEF